MKNKFNIWSSHGTDEIWMKKKKKEDKTWYYLQWYKYIPSIKTQSCDRQYF